MKENKGGKAGGRPPVCPLPYKKAIGYGKQMLEIYFESQKENVRCAEEIKRVIRESSSTRLDAECVKPVIREFGFERVRFVLAYNIQQDAASSNISKRNFFWSLETDVFPDETDGIDHRDAFRIPGCPCALNEFTDLVMEQQGRPELFNEKHCSPVNGANAKGKLLVLKPQHMEEFYDIPDWQVVYCMDADENSVKGISLKNGKPYHVEHAVFFGRLKEEFVPDWAAAWLDAFRECETAGQEPEHGIGIDF